MFKNRRAKKTSKAPIIDGKGLNDGHLLLIKPVITLTMMLILILKYKDNRQTIFHASQTVPSQ